MELIIREEAQQKAIMLNGGDQTGLQYNLYKFSKLIEESSDLAKCTQESKDGVFLDVIMNGLDIPDVFITKRNKKVGEQWVSVMEWDATPMGKVKKAMQSGVIAYVDEPVVVYSCDTWAYKSANDIQHEPMIPRTEGAEMIACYVKITRRDSSYYYSVMAKEDYKLLAQAAIKQVAQRKGATQEDVDRARQQTVEKYAQPGMFKAKCLKHAMNKLPQIRILGNFQNSTQDAQTEIQ